MFVNVGFGEAAPGREKDVEAAMRAFGDWLSDAPGLVAIHLLRDPQSGQLTGVSLWKDRESFAAAMSRPRSDHRKMDPAMYARLPETRSGDVVATWPSLRG